MCKACKDWQDIAMRRDAHMPMQTELDPVALARYRRAKSITDPAKLRAMLPAWIKAHDRAVAPPKPFVFVPNRPPVYARIETGAEWNAKWHPHQSRGQSVQMHYVEEPKAKPARRRKVAA